MRDWRRTDRQTNTRRHRLTPPPTDYVGRQRLNNAYRIFRRIAKYLLNAENRIFVIPQLCSVMWTGFTSVTDRRTDI